MDLYLYSKVKKSNLGTLELCKSYLRLGTVTFLVMRIYLNNILFHNPVSIFKQDIVHQCRLCLNNIPLTIQLLLKQRYFHQSSILSFKNPFVYPAYKQPQIMSSIQFIVNKGFFHQSSFYLSHIITIYSASNYIKSILTACNMLRASTET